MCWLPGSRNLRPALRQLRSYAPPPLSDSWLRHCELLSHCTYDHRRHGFREDGVVVVTVVDIKLCRFRFRQTDNQWLVGVNKQWHIGHHIDTTLSPRARLRIRITSTFAVKIKLIKIQLKLKDDPVYYIVTDIWSRYKTGEIWNVLNVNLSVQLTSCSVNCCMESEAVISEPVIT